MRFLIVAIPLAWIPLGWQPLRGQPPTVRKDVPKNPKQKPNFTSPKPQIGTDASPFVVETHPRPESEKETAETKADKDRAARIERWMVVFTGAVAVFTGLLVWVGWRGVNAALRTLKNIEKQADLMAIPFRSWIALENWKAEYVPDQSPPYISTLRIQVEMVNKTNSPLTITEGSIKFKIAGGSGHTRYEIGEGFFLPPRSPHIIKASVLIAEGNAGIFTQGRFLCPIEGHVSHYGALGEANITTQKFSGFLDCGEGREATFHYETHLNPETQQEEQADEQQPPN